MPKPPTSQPQISFSLSNKQLQLLVTPKSDRSRNGDSAEIQAFSHSVRGGWQPNPKPHNQPSNPPPPPQNPTDATQPHRRRRQAVPRQRRVARSSLRRRFSGEEEQGLDGQPQAEGLLRLVAAAARGEGHGERWRRRGRNFYTPPEVAARMSDAVDRGR
ncbi:hypothetical protein Acr_00g0048400 [Actinidia rufa]|uniref:Uncharacterized protein n=1 Tax=Actinidia rufa TaxID=165716 RepID=A0A7J0DK56_9ERIC|nr:hypothetical protein Acr_00g0048400 [Actinidia rufa]